MQHAKMCNLILSRGVVRFILGVLTTALARLRMSPCSRPLKLMMGVVGVCKIGLLNS